MVAWECVFISCTGTVLESKDAKTAGVGNENEEKVGLQEGTRSSS